MTRNDSDEEADEDNSMEGTSDNLVDETSGSFKRLLFPLY